MSSGTPCSDTEACRSPGHSDRLHTGHKVGDSTVADLRKQVRRRTRTDRGRRDNFGRGFALALLDRFGPVLLRGFVDIVIAI
jgi:hypothetical protein